MRHFLLAVAVCAAVACGPAVPWAAHGTANSGQTRAAVERAVAALAERGSAWPGTEGADGGWLPADYTLTIARDGSWTLDETVLPEIDPLQALMGNQAPPAGGGAAGGLTLFPGLGPLVPITRPAAPAAPAAAAVRADGKAPMVQIRANGPAAITMDQILANAKRLVGVPYVWGGNSESGLDCSAYVSKAWGVGRYTTDSIAAVSFKIPKDELLPGDIMNLTTREDPQGYGHVRLFAGWANAERTRVWVYEETPPRSLYRAIAYDAAYTPMRRVNYVPDGDAAAAVQAALAAGASAAPVGASGSTGTSPRGNGGSGKANAGRSENAATAVTGGLDVAAKLLAGPKGGEAKAKKDSVLGAVQEWFNSVTGGGTSGAAGSAGPGGGGASGGGTKAPPKHGRDKRELPAIKLLPPSTSQDLDSGLTTATPPSAGSQSQQDRDTSTAPAPAPSRTATTPTATQSAVSPWNWIGSQRANSAPVQPTPQPTVVARRTPQAAPTAVPTQAPAPSPTRAPRQAVIVEAPTRVPQAPAQPSPTSAPAQQESRRQSSRTSQQVQPAQQAPTAVATVAPTQAPAPVELQPQATPATRQRTQQAPAQPTAVPVRPTVAAPAVQPTQPPAPAPTRAAPVVPAPAQAPVVSDERPARGNGQGQTQSQPSQAGGQGQGRAPSNPQPTQAPARPTQQPVRPQPTVAVRAQPTAQPSQSQPQSRGNGGSNGGGGGNANNQSSNGKKR